MKTLILPRHYWLSFGRPIPIRQRAPLLPHLAAHETKARPPTPVQERFWVVGKVRLFGIVLPNTCQMIFFAGVCLVLALPVFLCDTSGRGWYHGFITLVSLAAFAAACWIVGMTLANTVEGKAEPPSSDVKG